MKICSVGQKKVSIVRVNGVRIRRLNLEKKQGLSSGKRKLSILRGVREAGFYCILIQLRISH